MIEPPVRACCGQRHAGRVCPDGKVMCCMCFARFEQDQLNVMADGDREDVCQDCARRERLAAERIGHTLCFGCRAIVGLPPCAADQFPPDEDWERFNCRRCGVEDVRPRQETT